MMKSSTCFSAQTPILHRGSDTKDTQWILWPVYAHPTIFSCPVNHGLNLFQELVLRLEAAGIEAENDLAEITKLHRGLLEKVCQELVSKGYLSQFGGITPKGDELVKDIVGQQRSDDAGRNRRNDISGYVFTDALSGRILPRVLLESPERHYATPKHSTHYSIEVGTPEKSWTIEFYPIVPGDHKTPSKPTRSAVNIALKRHQQAESDLRRKTVFDLGWHSPFKTSPFLEDVAGFFLPDMTPEPMFLSFCLVARGRQSDFFIRDPFLSDYAFWMRDWVREEKSKSEHSRLSSRIDALLKKENDVTDSDLNEAKGTALRKTAKTIIEHFGSAIEQEVILFGMLCEMEKQFLCSEQKAMISTSFAILEHVLDEALMAYPQEGTIHALSSSSSDNFRTINGIARSMGFVTDGLEDFLNPDREMLRQIQKGKRILKGTLAALIAAANDHVDHPLRRLAWKRPSWFQDVQRWQEKRIPTWHAAVQRGTAPDEPTNILPFALGMEDIRELTFLTCQILLGEGSQPIGSTSSNVFSEVQANIRQKYRNQARHEIDRHFPREIYGGVRNELIDFESTYRFITDTGHDDDVELKRTGSVLVEAALIDARKLFGHKQVHREEFHPILRERLRQTGLLPPQGKLPDILSRTHWGYINISLQKRGNRSVGAAALALLYILPKETLYRLAKIDPAWIERINEIIEIRGHMGRPTSDKEFAPKTYHQNIRTIVKSLFESLV